MCVNLIKGSDCGELKCFGLITVQMLSMDLDFVGTERQQMGVLSMLESSDSVAT